MATHAHDPGNSFSAAKQGGIDLFAGGDRIANQVKDGGLGLAGDRRVEVLQDLA